MSFKPLSYTSVAPYLVVNNASDLVEFLIKVFNAERLRIYYSENGRLKHGELRIDDTVVMIADAVEGWPAAAAHIHVYVEDVDETFRRALEYGATIVQEPTKRDDSDKRGGFKHASGITWWVAQQIDADQGVE